MVACATDFHPLHLRGTLGIHPSSAVIERVKREVLDWARVALVQVGLTVCFGPYPVQRVIFMDNSVRRDPD
eukprot:7257376-Lingulodinium_polyedra.AAC.1